MNDSRIQELLNQKDYRRAQTMIQEELTRDPQSADAHYFQGVLHYFQGSVGPTIQHLRKALEIDPRHTDSAICLSVLMNDIGKYEEAKKVFEQANQSVVHRREGTISAIDLKFAVKHLEIADLYFRYRRYEEAIEEYSKAVLLNPQHLDIRIRRAKAYARKGFVTRAMQDLQALKHERPDFVPAALQLGLLHYSQGNVLDAELEWEGVLQSHPAHREATAYLEMAREKRQS